MGESRYSSIYLPMELKRQLVEAAKAEGFLVSRGRQSCLARFIEVMLQEHRLLEKNDPIALSLHSLTPELRSSISRLSEANEKRQRHVSAVLDLLLEDRES